MAISTEKNIKNPNYIVFIHQQIDHRKTNSMLLKSSLNSIKQLLGLLFNWFYRKIIRLFSKK